MDNSIVARAVSRQKLRNLVFRIRVLSGHHNELYFDVVRFIENELHEIVPDFSTLISPIQEMGNSHGNTFPDNNTIYIREDIYQGAYKGNGRDRMTLAHEIGHLFLHTNGRISHARLAPGESTPRYKQPEWQAKAFAGELLIPFNLIRGLSTDEIVKSCGVSRQAAEIAIKNSNKNRNPARFPF